MKEYRTSPTAHTKHIRNRYSIDPQTLTATTNTGEPINWATFDPPKREDEDALRSMLGIPTD